MAGFLPNEGQALNANLALRNADVDRGVGLELLLFTNTAPSATITAATLTEPVGTGYARIPLNDALWTGTGSTLSYAQQTFTGGAGGWTGSIQGYAIVSTGVTPRIMAIEVDPNGPYTIAVNDTYKITPNITYA